MSAGGHCQQPSFLLSAPQSRYPNMSVNFVVSLREERMTHAYVYMEHLEPARTFSGFTAIRDGQKLHDEIWMDGTFFSP